MKLRQKSYNIHEKNDNKNQNQHVKNDNNISR